MTRDLFFFFFFPPPNFFLVPLLFRAMRISTARSNRCSRTRRAELVAVRLRAKHVGELPVLNTAVEMHKLTHRNFLRASICCTMGTALRDRVHAHD